MENNNLKLVPSLNDLVLDPFRVETLSADEAREMLARLVSIQSVLLAKAFSGNESGHQPKENNLLDVEQASKRMGCSKDWLYRHSKTLPFVRRVSRRQLRFDPAGIDRYLRNKVI